MTSITSLHRVDYGSECLMDARTTYERPSILLPPPLSSRKRRRKYFADLTFRDPKASRCIYRAAPLVFPLQLEEMEDRSRPFGYAHEQVEAQPPKPFWHQHPSWAQPGAPLYFHPSVGYSDRPLYHAFTDDGMPVIVRYESKQDNGEPIRNGRRERKRVEIYEGGAFVESITLRTLKRFSRSAVERFTEHVPMPFSKDAESADQLRTPSVAMEPIGHICELASEAESSSTISSESRRFRTLSDMRTLQTDMTNHSNASHTPLRDSRSVPSSTRSTAEPETFKIEMKAIELPSTEAIRAALRWMEDNAPTRFGEALSEFGPSDLEKVEFWDLIDLYQAALAFRMRPFPARLKLCILDRVSNTTPDLHFFQTLTRYLPMNDPVIARLINTIENCRKQCRYTDADMADFNEFIFADGNEDLLAEVNDILDDRRGKWTKRNGHRHGHQGDGKDAVGEPSENSGESPAAVGKIHESSAAEGKTHESSAAEGKTNRRRRNRRAQQQRWRPSKSKEVR